MLALLCLALLSSGPPSEPAAAPEPSSPPRVTVTIAGSLDELASMWILGELKDAKPGAEVRIEIDTPGGDFDAAVSISQAIEKLAPDHKVVCVVDGSALSGGFLILQSCPMRVMTARSALMAHEPYLPMASHLTGARLKQFLSMVRVLAGQYAAHGAARLKISLAEFARRIDGQDWWLSPADALKFSAVDRVDPSPNAALHP